MKPSIVLISDFNDYGEILTTTIIKGTTSKKISVYDRSANLTIEKALQTSERIKEIFLKAYHDGIVIACNDFKSHIKALDLPLTLPDTIYQINDVTDITSSDIILHKYQNITAKACIVYQFMENNGLYRNYEHVNPIYDCNTFSGRSRSKSFNIQGYTDHDQIRTIFAHENDVILWFDWVSADIRVAAELSQDEELKNSFMHSDPYEYMTNKLNDEIENGQISREECKDFLLKAINSLNMDNELLHAVYPKLTSWLRKLFVTPEHNFSLTTLLGRKFDINNSKNKLAVINGSMQGSVVHAMQNVLVKLYDRIPNNIICEVHDSIAINCRNNSSDIKSMIDIVKDSMLYPLDNGMCFPFKVSVGKVWRKWKYLKTIR